MVTAAVPLGREGLDFDIMLYLLALAPFLTCCVILGNSLTIFSIETGVTAPTTLQGCCENRIGWWIWKDLNCKEHPLLTG